MKNAKRTRAYVAMVPVCMEYNTVMGSTNVETGVMKPTAVSIITLLLNYNKIRIKSNVRK